MVFADRKVQGAHLLDSRQVRSATARSSRCFSVHLHGASHSVAAIAGAARASEMADAGGPPPVLSLEAATAAGRQPGCWNRSFCARDASGLGDASPIKAWRADAAYSPGEHRNSG